MDLAFVSLLVLMYFIPAIIAFVRQHHNQFPIFLTNLLFGWTIVIWFVCLIWATTASKTAGNDKVESNLPTVNFKD